MTTQPLTKRDVDVILDVYKHRYLKTSQIQQLHFPSERTTTRRLKFLIDAKLLKHFNVPNIPERIYQVSTRGANLVAQHQDTSVSDLLWSRTTAAPKDYYFMQHFLAINDFRIQTTEACEKSDIQLSGFIPEYYGHKHSSGRITKHIKDFVFGLAARVELRADIHEHHSRQALAVATCEQCRDAPAQGMTDQHQPFDAEGFRHSFDVADHRFVIVVAVLRPARVAVAAVVEGEHPVVGRHAWGEVVPDVGLIAVAVEQEHGHPVLAPLEQV